jgi:hypothetical protein
VGGAEFGYLSMTQQLRAAAKKIGTRICTKGLWRLVAATGHAGGCGAGRVSGSPGRVIPSLVTRPRKEFELHRGERMGEGSRRPSATSLGSYLECFALPVGGPAATLPSSAQPLDRGLVAFAVKAACSSSTFRVSSRAAICDAVGRSGPVTGAFESRTDTSRRRCRDGLPRIWPSFPSLSPRDRSESADGSYG